MTDKLSTIALDLERLGIQRPNGLHVNLSTPRLVEAAVARGEGVLTSSGALAVRTGARTGRSPGDKFMVQYAERSSAGRIWWGDVNRPLAPEDFERLRARVCAYLQRRDLFLQDTIVGADPRYSLPVRVISEFAWHNLFARQIFRQPEAAPPAAPRWTILCAPRFLADPAIDGTRSETAVVLDVEQRLVLICGTEYAGEIKKALFTVMNYTLPQQSVLPMHCAANVGPDGDVALFFGLAGAGKTTLSTDPERRLIGDDTHGWGDHGVFNIEGGCHAKCFNLSREREPQIWDAIRFGTVLENVVVDAHSGEADYADGSLTENTRAAYPVEHIPGGQSSGRGGHPATIFFLTADAFGALPPIARLTADQIRYYFLSGYGVRATGTEVSVLVPEATFSAAFSQPFLPLPPRIYADMLGEKIARYGARVYLVNTGWTGGSPVAESRIKLEHTRAMVRAALGGRLDDVPTYVEPVFGLRVPLKVPDVPSEMLRPRSGGDAEGSEARARKLAAQFAENFRRFPDAPSAVAEAGPRS